jgi:hypothetical protein
MLALLDFVEMLGATKIESIFTNGAGGQGAFVDIILRKLPVSLGCLNNNALTGLINNMDAPGRKKR